MPGCDNPLVADFEVPQPKAALRCGFNLTAALLHGLGERRFLIADAIANAAFALQPARRSVTARNFRLALPGLTHRQARRMAAASFREYARTGLDFLYFHHLPRAKLISLVRVHGLDEIRRLQDRGQGAVLVLCHLGAWDAAGSFATAMGVPLTSVMADEGNRTMRDLVVWARAEMGIRVSLASASARLVVRTLRHGGWLALLADLPGDTPCVEVTFLGHRTRFSTLPVRLAQTTGCALLPVVAVRNGAGGYFIDVHPACQPDPSSTVEDGWQPLLEVFERAVRRWPEQWYPFGEGRLVDGLGG